jgi:uncharacterized membrane protein
MGSVEQSQHTRRYKNRCLIIGAAVMIAVMLLLRSDAIAHWRPLCIACILLWLACIRLIVSMTATRVGTPDTARMPPPLQHIHEGHV